MGVRFEFDPVNKVLMVRVEGPLTSELFEEYRQAIRKHSAASGARAGIVDLSSVTEFPLSSEFLDKQANQEPPMGIIPRIIVAPAPVGFGLSRMFQTVGQSKTSLLEVVRTMDEAFAALSLQSPHFEPLE